MFKLMLTELLLITLSDILQLLKQYFCIWYNFSLITESLQLIVLMT